MKAPVDVVMLRVLRVDGSRADIAQRPSHCIIPMAVAARVQRADTKNAAAGQHIQARVGEHEGVEARLADGGHGIPIARPGWVRHEYFGRVVVVPGVGVARMAREGKHLTIRQRDEGGIPAPARPRDIGLTRAERAGNHIGELRPLLETGVKQPGAAAAEGVVAVRPVVVPETAFQGNVLDAARDDEASIGQHGMAAAEDIGGRGATGL